MRGHEIPQIHVQSQGIGMGHSGLYENAALEHQADTEGMLAAQGRSIYSDGMDAGIGMQYGLGMRGVEGLTPLSGGMSASAGAPMQAWKFGDMIKNLFSGGKKAKGTAEAAPAPAYIEEAIRNRVPGYRPSNSKKVTALQDKLWKHIQENGGPGPDEDKNKAQIYNLIDNNEDYYIDQVFGYDEEEKYK